MNAKEIKREIGRRLKTAREARGLTLDGLFKATGSVLSGSRINNYERGNRQPGPWEILLLNKELRGSPTYFMCLDEGDEMLVATEKFLRDWQALPENIRMDFARKIHAVAMAYIDTTIEGPKPSAPKSKRKIRKGAAS